MITITTEAPVVQENNIDTLLMNAARVKAACSKEYTPSPTVLMENKDHEMRERAIILLESAITFDDLNECPEMRSKTTIREAIRACIAKAYLKDETAYYKAVYYRHQGWINELCTLWLDMKGVYVEEDGLSDWEQTVFETVKTRKSSRPDVKAPYRTNVYAGHIKRSPNYYEHTINKEHAVALAFAWLEGDNSVQPINKEKTRHRSNGAWILVFDSKHFSGIHHSIESVTVTIDKDALRHHGMEDRDTGEPMHIDLKRGSHPRTWFKKELGKKWPAPRKELEEEEAPRWKYKTSGKAPSNGHPMRPIAVIQFKRALVALRALRMG